MANNYIPKIAQKSQQPLIFQVFTDLPFGALLTHAVTFQGFTPLILGRHHWQIQNFSSLFLPSSPFIGPSRTPLAKIIARDAEMAPKKSKSKLDVEEVADLSMGWRKSKMSEMHVQELEDMKLLQSQAVIQ